MTKYSVTSLSTHILLCTIPGCMQISNEQDSTLNNTVQMCTINLLTVAVGTMNSYLGSMKGFGSLIGWKGCNLSVPQERDTELHQPGGSLRGMKALSLLWPSISLTSPSGHSVNLHLQELYSTTIWNAWADIAWEWPLTLFYWLCTGRRACSSVVLNAGHIIKTGHKHFLWMN